MACCYDLFRYYDAGQEVALEQGCRFVPLWDDLNDPGLFHDGLHFNERGGEKLFNLLWPHLDALTKGLETQEKPWAEMPTYWDELK